MLAQYESVVKSSVDQWEKAIAFAPHVSMEYWKTLVERHAKSLSEGGNEEAVNYELISNNISSAVQALLEREEYEDAKLIRILSDSHVFKDPVAPYTKQGETVPDPKSAALGMDPGKMSPEGVQTLKEISHKESNKLFSTGEVVLAACAELGANACEEAIAKLIRGNELFLAYSVAQLLKSPALDEVAHLLGLRAERLDLPEYAFRYYSVCRDKSLLQFFAVRNKFDSTRCGVKTAGEYEGLIKAGVSPFAAVKYNILAGKIEEAAKIAAERIESTIWHIENGVEIMKGNQYDDFGEVVQLEAAMQNVSIGTIGSEYGDAHNRAHE